MNSVPPSSLSLPITTAKRTATTTTPTTNSKRFSDVDILSAAPTVSRDFAATTAFSEMQKCPMSRRHRQKYDTTQDTFDNRWDSKLHRDTSDGLVACQYPLAQCCTTAPRQASASTVALSEELPYVKNSNVSFKTESDYVLGSAAVASETRTKCNTKTHKGVGGGKGRGVKVKLKDKHKVLGSGNLNYSALNRGDDYINNNDTVSSLVDDLLGSRHNDKYDGDKHQVEEEEEDDEEDEEEDEEAATKVEELEDDDNYKYERRRVRIDGGLIGEDDGESSTEDILMKKIPNWESFSDDCPEPRYFPRSTPRAMKLNIPCDTGCMSLKHQIENIEANMTIDAIKQGEDMLIERCTHLRDQLVKERALTCKLVTQKTIAEQRCKIVESQLEGEQEWRLKTVEDVEVAKRNIRQISDVYREVVEEMRKEKKLNLSLEQKLQRDKKKRKQSRLELVELTEKVQQLEECRTAMKEEKDELTNQIECHQEALQLCRTENCELTKKLQKEWQSRQKTIVESNDKISVLKDKMDEGKSRMKHRYEDLKMKIEELQDQVKSERAQHDITKNAYNMLNCDWNKLYERYTELRMILGSVTSNTLLCDEDLKLSISD